MPGESRDVVDIGSVLVVEDRGRVDEEAIFGKVDTDLRVEFITPEARFLSQNKLEKCLT